MVGVIPVSPLTVLIYACTLFSVSGRPSSDDAADGVAFVFFVIDAQQFQCGTTSLCHGLKLDEGLVVILLHLSQPTEVWVPHDIQRIIVPQSSCNSICTHNFSFLI